MPVNGATPQVSYNPNNSIYHAPISSVGLIGLNHVAFGPQDTTRPAVPSGGSGLPDLTPPGSIRFINDSSYVIQSETSVAVDPANPNHIVGTYNDGRYFLCPVLAASACPSGYTDSLSGFTTSSNGGRSVAKTSFIPSLNVVEYDPSSSSNINSMMVSWGDPSVVAGPLGLFYYASLAIDPVTGANGVMIAVSNSSLWGTSTCTTTLTNPTANPCWKAALIYGNTTVGARTFEDKELGAVDWSVGSPYYGDIYVTWDHFFASGISSTYGARCDISLHCTMISGGSLAPLSGSDLFVAFSTPQVGKDGTVYASWCDYGTFTSYGPVYCRVASSPPGGGSFGTPTDIVSFMGGGTTFPNDTVVNGYATEQFRTASVPVIATDGTNANNVYFTIAVCTQGFYYILPSPNTDNPGNCGNSGIVFAKSTDKGATWTNQQIISKPAVNIQPWVTVDSGTGEVVVAYLTSQFDPFNHRIDVVAQLSTDGGTTWSTKRITSVSDEPNSDPEMYDYTIASGFGGSLVVPQFGDYFQVQAIHGSLYALYTGNYVPEQGTYKASPFLAVTPSTAAHLVLSPSGSSPKSSSDPVTQASPGGSVPFNATGFAPGSNFTLSLNWGGLTQTLASGVVSSTGAVAGTFTVPNIQSEVYTVTASDTSGDSAARAFGVQQVDLTPVQNSISQLSSTISSGFASLGTSISTLSSTLGTDVSSLQASIAGVNSSLTSVSKSLSGSINALSGQMTTLQGSIPNVSNISSTLTTVEYLVVIVIVLALLATIFAALAMRSPKPKQ